MQMIEKLCGANVNFTNMEDPPFYISEPPLMTTVIVRKRNQVRLLPGPNARPADTIGKHRNVMPGTVLDRSLCTPYLFNWYMVASAGIIGTVRTRERNLGLIPFGHPEHNYIP